ncbi:hypothetical protein niasHS_013784 [Heterodera schachtii]|uniref:26S proteasome non-ATPase regulatory subunit 2 n=1 Tax=Heterodera schachtii TaxID=97005 RepID=A0ABD2ILU1_HETSC
MHEQGLRQLTGPTGFKCRFYRDSVGTFVRIACTYEMSDQIISEVDEVEQNLLNNAEIEACDLLIEAEQLDKLLELAKQPKFADMDYGRICLYLLSCVPFMPDPENTKLIKVAKELYLNYGKQIEALRCAMKMNDVGAVSAIFGECKDRTLKMQMAMMLGRQQIFLELPDGEDGLLGELNANSHLHKHFLALARELDIMTPKSPDDVYKMHLEQTRPFTHQTKDTARHNLASSFVNGFVNCGFGSDSLFKTDKGINDWLAKHKEWNAFSSAASFGLIHHWNANSLNTWGSLSQSNNSAFIKGGALLANGIVFSGIQDEVDPAYALLTAELMSKDLPLRVAATFGLGLAYANSKRDTALTRDEGVVTLLLRVLNDPEPGATPEVKALAALSLGLVLVGTGNTPPAKAEFVSSMDVVADLINYLHSIDVNEPNARFVALGIGLIFLGRQDDYDDTICETLRSLPSPFGEMASTLVEVCAYAGTGNVLKVQKMLHICTEHTDKKENSQTTSPVSTAGPGDSLPNGTTTTAGDVTPKTGGGDEDEKMEEDYVSAAAAGGPTAGSVPPKKASTGAAATVSATAAGAKPAAATAAAEQSAGPDHSLKQSIATMGIALIAMGEDIGCQMSLRIFSQLTRYGDAAIRRAVPLALALLNTSNPQLTIIETLSKYSHDADTETARNAIFALGLVGAGTNNARILAILRQLASFHSKDQNTMMLLRITQGLMHLGKGTQTLNPFHSDRQLMCPAAVAALLTTCFAFIDGEKLILNGRQHYLFYTLVAAIQPRMLITVLQDPLDPTRLVQKAVNVRVGQAVDVVAQAGKPRAITGFQTHNTPVLLSCDERAELAVEEYEPMTPTLEGIVILRELTKKSGGPSTE